MSTATARAVSTGQASAVQERWMTAGTFLVADFIALTVAGLSSSVLRNVVMGTQVTADLPYYFPAAVAFAIVFASVGLYPGIALNPIEEFRRILKGTTISYLVVIGGSFFEKESASISRLFMLLAWVSTVVLAYALRSGVRHVCSKRSWWGVSAVVMGAGRTGNLVMEILAEHPSLGLKPVALLDDDPSRLPTTGNCVGGPILGQLSLAPILAQRHGVQYAIVAMPGVSSRELSTIVSEKARGFPHVLIIPDLFGMSSLWVSAKDIGGMLGLEVSQALMQPVAKITKRAIDQAVGWTVFLTTLPLFAVLYAAARTSSPGPVFYGQRRVGRDGELFTAWKFRSMVLNSDEVLEQHLAKHPELIEHWNRYRKLHGPDPRVTAVGRFLRRTSLDELPQIWNVLKGEMSLVGPRPIMTNEIEQYGDRISLYTQVRPGVTGLWQISGRANTTFEARVQFDEYYVRNWSVWLDLYIFVRTVKTVLLREGAY